MSGADWVWGGLLAAGAGFEAYALANARAGAATFAVAWLAFSGWYLWHIID